MLRRVGVAILTTITVYYSVSSAEKEALPVFSMEQSDITSYLKTKDFLDHQNQLAKIYVNEN